MKQEQSSLEKGEQLFDILRFKKSRFKKSIKFSNKESIKVALADQKAKIREWLHNWLDNKYKDNDLWKLSETELYELLLKEFEELK